MTKPTLGRPNSCASWPCCMRAMCSVICIFLFHFFFMRFYFPFFPFYFRTISVSSLVGRCTIRFLYCISKDTGADLRTGLQATSPAASLVATLTRRRGVQPLPRRGHPEARAAATGPQQPAGTHGRWRLGAHGHGPPPTDHRGTPRGARLRHAATGHRPGASLLGTHAGTPRPDGWRRRPQAPEPGAPPPAAARPLPTAAAARPAEAEPDSRRVPDSTSRRAAVREAVSSEPFCPSFFYCISRICIDLFLDYIFLQCLNYNLLLLSY
jgi:hypothetical protein